ncbi:inosamine-phosphate amidinotransferase 1 [Streptomyces ficellus]|uniref:Inosamine-phosphate amidinotransferase 1 n=1 Tax=Streptomyces ficellus TaxID=1977088 RepID=A0A1W5T2I3_9ACTN|nr:inosamine-phosphate amidinotransferase 1 [Streptomyces ficellus]ARF06227.1 scyllo-inosamine-4-phosphate amidinotransferase [Streptomyces ficellus]QGV77876.1 inosamine-phosphate amidinotransferase 1 [Streptomyces ficellus]
MSLVNVHTEWDPLEEIVVGTMEGARMPIVDRSLLATEFPDIDDPQQIPTGLYPAQVAEETEAELEALADLLTGLGVTVRRPGGRDHKSIVSTPDWSTDGFYDYCPRDGFLAVGDAIIESPMVLRSRWLEGFAYKDLFLEYSDSGARWLSAPKPQLTDDMYEPTAPPGQRLRDLEPAFDAANILRFGTDLLYQVSDSGNKRGARWLQSVLGPQYTVHPCENLYTSTHIDSTIVPLRPGLLLVNPARVTEDNFPDFLRGWDRIVCPELVDTGFVGDHPKSSVWIGMNFLVIAPGKAIVDKRQTGLIRELERHGVEVIPSQLTHSRTLGGGFHCVTLDVRRAGELATYR